LLDLPQIHTIGKLLDKFLEMLAANVKLPLISILNGPVVIGVTSVFVAVTAMVFKEYHYL
jgi:hypothetical protein